MSELEIGAEDWAEIARMSDGTFAPLKSFMNERDFTSVCDEMRMADGTPFPIPITLPVPADRAAELESQSSIELVASTHGSVAKLQPSQVFEVDLQASAKKIFGTLDEKHPGVKRELNRSPFRIAGDVEMLQKFEEPYPELAFSPEDTKALFKERGFKTVVGFQTRNPPHRAHEYLQRVAMEICDGIFIQPLIGWKKPGDFSPEAVIAGYKVLAEEYYPKETCVLGTLVTPMRYAGPREAVFHAIIRRNHGCTHFIVGRDHAGVGGFYERYAAHRLCEQFSDLGIEILKLRGPYYCAHSGHVVTEKTSRYSEDQQEQVSGTRMREMLSQGESPPVEFMRPAVAQELVSLGREGKLFVP